MRIVEWGDLNAGLDLFNSIISYQDRFRKLFSAVNDSVSDCRYFTFATEHAVLAVCDAIDNL